MMRIHLVEDEDPKREHLTRFLNAVFPEAEVEVTRSVRSALDRMTEPLPDVVLLDMSLPTFDVAPGESGGRPQGAGGLEFMRYAQFEELVLPVIVVTAYDGVVREGRQMDLPALAAELRRDFPETFRGLVYFNSVYGEWKAQLESLIRSSFPSA